MIARMIEHAKAEKRRIVQHLANAQKTRHEQRLEEYRNLGIDEDLLELLPSDPKETIPSPLCHQISERIAKQKRVEMQAENERVKAIFEMPWLHEKEKEMVQLQEEIENCRRDEVRRAKQYVLSTLSDSIKLFHVRHKTPAAEGIRLRKKMCITLRLLNKSLAYLVNSLFEPLPIAEDESSDVNDSTPTPRESQTISTPPRQDKGQKRQATEPQPNNKKPKTGLWSYLLPF
jgi:hypothetical protein